MTSSHFKPDRLTWAVLVVLAISLALRLLYASGVDVDLHSDMATYQKRALLFLSTGSFTEAVPSHYFAESVYRLPFYPLFIAAIYKLFGTAPMAVYIIQAFIGTLLLWGIYLLTSASFNNRLAGLCALIGSALYTPLIGYCGILLTETLFMTLAIFGFYGVFKSLTTSNLRWMVMAGVLFGLASLTRSIIFPIPFLLALWMLLFWKKLQPTPSTSISKPLQHSAVLLATTLLVISPWSIRNYIEYKQFIPLDSLTGLNLVIGNNDRATGGFTPRYSKSPQYQRAKAQSKTLPQLDKNLKAEMLQWIKDNPQRYTALTLKRLKKYFSAEYDGYSKSYEWDRIFFHHNGVMQVYRMVMQCIALTALAAGIVRLSPWIILLGGTSVYFYLVPALFYYHARYRLPGVPFVMILAGLTLAWVWQVLIKPRLKTA